MAKEPKQRALLDFRAFWQVCKLHNDFLLLARYYGFVQKYYHLKVVEKLQLINHIRAMRFDNKSQVIVYCG